MRMRKVKHTDVAAYVLGVLDQAEAYAFEEHLKGCGRCGRQVAEFTSVEDALAKADLRYLSPGATRCGRLSTIKANLVVVFLACVVAALVSSRSSRRFRRMSSDADISTPVPLDDQRLLPLPLTFE